LCSGKDGFPVYHGSKRMIFPPGVRSENAEWPNHVMERDGMTAEVY
jgi:hypothetical protein